MQIQKRTSRRWRVASGIIDDLRGNGVALDPDDEDVIEHMSERQLDVLGRAIAEAWAAGYKRAGG